MWTSRAAFWFLIVALTLPALSAFATEPVSPDAWIGTWEGRWKKDFRGFTIIIHKVEGDGVLATYKWEGDPKDRPSGHPLGGEAEISGTVVSDKAIKLIVRKTDDLAILIEKGEDGIFSAKWLTRGKPTNYADLKKK